MGTIHWIVTAVLSAKWFIPIAQMDDRNTVHVYEPRLLKYRCWIGTTKWWFARPSHRWCIFSCFRVGRRPGRVRRRSRRAPFTHVAGWSYPAPGRHGGLRLRRRVDSESLRALAGWTRPPSPAYTSRWAHRQARSFSFRSTAPGMSLSRWPGGRGGDSSPCRVWRGLERHHRQSHESDSDRGHQNELFGTKCNLCTEPPIFARKFSPRAFFTPNRLQPFGHVPDFPIAPQLHLHLPPPPPHRPTSPAPPRPAQPRPAPPSPAPAAFTMPSHVCYVQDCLSGHLHNFGLTLIPTTLKRRTVHNSVVDTILDAAPAALELKIAIHSFAIPVSTGKMLFPSISVQII